MQIRFPISVPMYAQTKKRKVYGFNKINFYCKFNAYDAKPQNLVNIYAKVTLSVCYKIAEPIWKIFGMQIIETLEMTQNSFYPGNHLEKA